MKTNTSYRLHKTNQLFSSLPRAMCEHIGDKYFTLLSIDSSGDGYKSITTLCDGKTHNFVVRNESWKKHVVEVAGLPLSGTYMKGTPESINIPFDFRYLFKNLPGKLFIDVKEITQSHVTISFPDINAARYRVSHIDFQAMFAFFSTERKDPLGSDNFVIPDSAKVNGVQARGDIWSKGSVFAPSATSVKIEFEFKTDQDRLDAIKFLTNMKVN